MKNKIKKDHWRNLARMTNMTHFSPLRRKNSRILALHKQVYSL